KPVDEVLHAALDEPRLNARLVSVFAGAAVLLAALGLYGVLTLLVVDRTRELGVRLALGAPPASLVRLVLARAGRLVVGGLAAGLALVIAVQPLLRAVLFGVTPVDPVSLALSIAVLGAVGFAAAVVPALRAGAIDPIGAIRAD
ncbi:MAG TPA: FtsX-like permease family protein, partial [Vicinamibacterales bacterium]|nr:FtsX-like permease family protein [Vicinamibacterales bacterium]